jgi:hypothetical protein
MEAIIGLDNDEEQVFYLSHKDDPSNVYKFSERVRHYSSFINDILDNDNTLLDNPENPIQLTVGTTEAFKVFVKLFQDISDQTFKSDFTIPKPLVHGKQLQELYGPHYSLWDHLVVLDRHELFKHLRQVNTLANFLSVDFILTESLAIIAHHLNDAKNMEEWNEIKDLANSFYTDSEY